MSKQRISTSLAPEVIIEQIGGSLQVKGWDEPEVVVQAEPQFLRLEEQDDVIRLSCDTSCELRLPAGAAVQLKQAAGEARFRLLEDSLKIEQVYGSLYLRNVAETTVDTVHGELLARQIAGDLNVETVHGNSILRDIQGVCLIGQVMGNLDLRDVDGDIRVTTMGNARLRLSVLSGSQYEIHAEGNIHCRLPEDTSLRLKLSSRAESISVKLVDGGQLYQEESVELELGGSAGQMTLSAGGAIYLSARETSGEDEEPHPGFDEYGRVPDDFGEQIARQVEAQIEAQMEMVNRQLNEQLAALNTTFSKSGMSAEETERIMNRARERSERAAAQAQEKVRRAQERLERKLEANRRREEQPRPTAWGAHHARSGWHVNFPPAPPPPPAKESVSDEERLMILRMLEQKKISLDEAEQLLSALEGK
jgi:hypothetical protein